MSNKTPDIYATAVYANSHLESNEKNCLNGVNQLTFSSTLDINIKLVEKQLNADFSREDEILNLTYTGQFLRAGDVIRVPLKIERTETLYAAITEHPYALQNLPLECVLWLLVRPH